MQLGLQEGLCCFGIGVFSISCLFRNVEDGFQWTFIGVYGPMVANLRENLWEELGSVRGVLVVISMLPSPPVKVIRAVESPWLCVILQKSLMTWG